MLTEALKTVAPNKGQYEAHVESASAHALESFRHIAKQYALFHIGFFALGFLELLGLMLFFTFLTQSAIFAFTLASIFFTGFTYFVLLFYLQAKKPQQLLDLKNEFIEECTSESHGHFAKIHALYQLFFSLHRQEYTFYPLSDKFATLSLLAKKFSVWTHWKDVHQLKQLLLESIIKYYVQLVQLKPTDLEIHAGLATAFLSLSKLYRDPRKSFPNDEHLWVSPDYHSKEMHDKFTNAAHKAIEELRIVDAYSPNDPWTHTQLAAIYQDLGLVENEIAEYELIVKLNPKDHEMLLRLGVLYFSQGQNAQALALYEKLKQIHPTKAEDLLAHYGSAFL